MNLINKITLIKKLLDDSWDILIIKKDSTWEFISPDLLDSRDYDTIHIIRRFEYAPISMVKAMKIIKEAEIALQIEARTHNNQNISLPNSDRSYKRNISMKTRKQIGKKNQVDYFSIKNKPLLSKKLMKGNWEIIIFRQTCDWEPITYDLLDSYDNEFIHLIYPYSYRFISIEKVDIVISEIERDIRNKIQLQTSEILEERTLFRLLEGGVVRKN